MLAIRIDFQSTSFMAPPPRLWEMLYIARLICAESAPTMAAQLPIPLMAAVAVFRPIF